MLAPWKYEIGYGVVEYALINWSHCKVSKNVPHFGDHYSTTCNTYNVYAAGTKMLPKYQSEKMLYGP